MKKQKSAAVLGHGWTKAAFTLAGVPFVLIWKKSDSTHCKHDNTLTSPS